MDIARLSTLTRSGYSPYRRSEPAGNAPGVGANDAGATLPVAQRSQPPVEYVVQGEVLEKRRGTAADAGFQLLDELRGMEQAWRRDTASTDTSSNRDARRAIASYNAQAAPAATLAARFIDTYV